MMLFTTYLIALIVMTFVPIIGNFMQAFLAPTFSMIFMTACAQTEQTGGLNPAQLRAAFAAPVSRRLFMLGGIYVFAALLMLVAVVAIFSLIGGAPFFELLTGSQNIKATPEQNGAVLLTLLVFFITFMPVFWYAAPLIVWQKMSVFQSMFYSFFSVIHAYRPFLVYFLSWLVIGVLCPAFLAGLLALIIGKGLAMLLLFVLTIVLTVVLYCSFYPTYVDVFGEPELPRVSEPDLS